MIAWSGDSGDANTQRWDSDLLLKSGYVSINALISWRLTFSVSFANPSSDFAETLPSPHSKTRGHRATSRLCKNSAKAQFLPARIYCWLTADCWLYLCSYGLHGTLANLDCLKCTLERNCGSTESLSIHMIDVILSSGDHVWLRDVYGYGLLLPGKQPNCPFLSCWSLDKINCLFK